MYLSFLPVPADGQVYMYLEPDVCFKRKLAIAAFFCIRAFI
jgi:hypothetical protein